MCMLNFVVIGDGGRCTLVGGPDAASGILLVVGCRDGLRVGMRVGDTLTGATDGELVGFVVRGAAAGTPVGSDVGGEESGERVGTADSSFFLDPSPRISTPNCS